MTDKEAIEEIKSLLLALGGQEYLKEEEPENYKLSEAIETILNLIQTQQEEIEILKQEKATAWEEWNIIDEYCEQEKPKYKAELEKKEKIIEEMAKSMSENMYCDFIRTTDDKCAITECRNCFKEYFINKVEKEKK